MAVLENFWVNDQTVLSERMNRFFRWAAWAELGGLLVVIFTWYCEHLTLAVTASPLKYLPVRIVLGTLGGAGGLGGLFLWDGMWTYWKLYDTSSKGTKRFWFCIMAILNIFGCGAYYWIVYRRQFEARNSQGG
jgi:hypothetical protein